MTTGEGKALLDHGKAVARRYARRIGVDMAEELRAEAMVRVLGSPPPDGRMEPWLERIFRNLVVDRWRRGRATVLLADMDPFPDARTPEDELLGHERRRRVRACLRALPRDARRALLFRFYGDLDDPIAAARLGVASTTVRTRVHRALAHLRARLGDLRAWVPPVFCKVGTPVATVGLAPVLLAVWLVAGPAPTPPTAISANPGAVEVRRPARRSPDRVVAKDSSTSPVPVAPAPPRAARRSLPGARTAPALAPSKASISPGETPPVREILHPDRLDIFAEPEPPASPCLVEAPPSLLAQIEKMMDDLL